MVALAKQLIQRQTTAYDPSDLEDRYESRLRSLIDAKLKGEGIATSVPAEPDRTNVAALKKSLAQEAAPRKAPLSSAPAKPKRAAAAQAARPTRKRA
jgi:DNA end-binding protein Ku